MNISAGLLCPILKKPWPLASMLNQLADHGLKCAELLSRVRLFATPWTAHQAPLSMGFSRRDPGLHATPPAAGLPALRSHPTGGLFTPEPPGKPTASDINSNTEGTWGHVLLALRLPHFSALCAPSHPAPPHREPDL